MDLIRPPLCATRTFWLLAYLFGVQIAMGNGVLCFEQNGNTAIEAGACLYQDHKASAADWPTVADLHLADSCRDVVIDTDSPLFPQGRQLLHYWAIDSVHPLAQARS